MKPFGDQQRRANIHLYPLMAEFGQVQVRRYINDYKVCLPDGRRIVRIPRGEYWPDDVKLELAKKLAEFISQHMELLP